jgi:long-chain acyl-CoA synthetase
MPEPASTSPPLTAAELSPHTTVGVMLRQVEASPTVAMLHHFCDGAWQTLTWAEARQAMLGIAAGLIAQGVQPGERVVIMSENRPHWILTDFAIQLVSAVTVPIYPTLTGEAAREIASDCGARLAIVSSSVRNVFQDTALSVILIDQDVPRWMMADPDPQTASLIVDRARSLSPKTVATVIYTSGTTGTPKGVVLTHASITTMAATGAQAFHLGRDGVLLSFLPYSHVFERVEGVMAPISAGATIWIARGAEFLAADLQAARPTMLLMVPRVLEKMVASIEAGVRRRSVLSRAMFRAALRIGHRATADHPGQTSRLAYGLADGMIFSRLRTRLAGGRLRFIVSGGAPLASDVEAFFWSIGLPIYQGWGLTETSAAATANRPGAIRHGSVGQPLPGVQVRAGEDGELLVKGPGVMREYLGRPEATASVLADAWLKTGDVGAIDADGFVTITDRKKDLIKTSTGKYVAPQPLENKLQSFRYIAAAVLVGDRRPYIVALIQPAWDELRQEFQLNGSPEQLAADSRVQQMVKGAVETINRGLANFETIKRFRIVAGEFTEANGELTPSLKVRRRLVQQRYQRLIDEMYGAE